MSTSIKDIKWFILIFGGVLGPGPMSLKVDFCQTPDLGQGLEFDFTFAMEQ